MSHPMALLVAEEVRKEFPQMTVMVVPTLVEKNDFAVKVRDGSELVWKSDDSRLLEGCK